MNIEISKNDFESPESLTKQELLLLQQEIKTSQKTQLGEKLEDNEKQKKFIEEKNHYLERSKNETSKRWVQSLFDRVLKKYGFDEQTLSELKNQDTQQTERLQTTDNQEKTSEVNSEEQQANNPTWNTDYKGWANLQSTINTPQLGNLDWEKEKNWLETIIPNIQEIADDVEWEIEKNINLLEPIHTWELLSSLLKSTKKNFREEWERMKSNQELFKKRIPEKKLEEHLAFGNKSVQVIEKLCSEIESIISKESDQWAIITKDNYNKAETIWKTIEYVKRILKKIENDIDISEFEKLSAPDFMKTRQKDTEAIVHTEQKKQYISLDLEQKMWETLYKLLLSHYLSTKRIEKNPIPYN